MSGKPCDIPMEQACLGACLIDDSNIPAVREHILSAEDFFETSHQLVWQAMLTLDGRRQHVDVLTVMRQLEATWLKEFERNALAVVGGTPYLDVLCEAAESAAHAGSYAEKVAHRAADRRILACSHDMARLAWRTDLAPQDKAANMIQLTEKTLAGTIRRPVMTLTQGFRQLGTFLGDLRDRQIAAEQAGQPFEPHLLGIPTGFRRLDQITGGIVPGMPWLLGGMPGWGKTSLVLALIRAAAAAGYHAYLSCADSSIVAMARREVARWRSVSIRDVTSSEAFEAEDVLAEELGNRVYIDDDRDCLIDEAAARVALTKLRDPKLGLWAIDYATHYAKSEDWKDVGHVSRVVTKTGWRLKMGTILLQQLKESVEQREPEKRRPQASDIAHAAQLRRDARVIVVPYQPHRDMPRQYAKDYARIYVLKNSDGPAGMWVAAHWDSKTATYSEPPPQLKNVQGQLDEPTPLDEIEPGDVPG